MMPDVERALAVANYLRGLGLTPLPTRSDDKIPDLHRYTHFYAGEPVPESVYGSDWRATNLQVITGTKHPGKLKVIVVDQDGDEAPEAWDRICRAHDYRPTSAWMAETGSGGTHIYYRLPPGTEECKSGLIWAVYDTWGDDGKGDWLKHKEVRILGDRALAMFPPSFHPKTGRRYRFRPGCSPNDILLPEVAPAWLLDLPRLVAPRFQAPPAAPVFRKPERLSGKHYMRGEVLSAIPDKVELLRSWGLKTERRDPNESGWVPCYVPWRESPGKSSPSGSLNARDGTFQDRKDNSSISFFDLAALLQPGMFPKWTDCRDYCGDRYIGRIQRG